MSTETAPSPRTTVAEDIPATSIRASALSTLRKKQRDYGL
jgi:hypothetical protein